MKMKSLIAFSISCYLGILPSFSGNNTSRGTLTPKNQSAVEMIESIATISDSTSINNGLVFDSKVISIKGFDKRANENKETFFVTNNSTFDISRLQIKLRYTDINDNMLHERTEIINCEIPSNSTRQVEIKSFDSQRSFYYYLSPKPKQQRTPFKASFQLLRYDIIIAPKM